MTKGTANRRSRGPGDMSADQQGAEGGDPFVVWLLRITTEDEAPERRKKRKEKPLNTSTKHPTSSTFKDLNYCALLYFFHFCFLPEPERD